MSRRDGQALIGSTGFVGSNLRRQMSFDADFHRSDIDAIRGRGFGIVVCAAAPAAKWIANRNPDEDRANIARLISCLKTVAADSFVLISTVDVYSWPVAVFEDSAVDIEAATAYGRHRFELEEFVRSHFPAHHVVRLPGLYGAGLKKNFIFDLLNDNCLHLTHRDSVYQFYGLDRLASDLQIVRTLDLRTVNLATEPVSAATVARECFDMPFEKTEAQVTRYDMRTRHADEFGGGGWYIESAASTLRGIRAFVESERGRLR